MNAGDAGHAPGQKHIARGRRGDGKSGGRLDDALEIRLTGEPIARCPRVCDRRRRGIRRAGDGGDAAGEQQAFRYGPGEKRDLAVQRSGAAKTERP